jgi:hypothetical protein
MDINLLEKYIQLTFPYLNFKMENVERIQVEESDIFYGYKKIYFKMKNSYMNYVIHFNEKELSIF